DRNLLGAAGRQKLEQVLRIEPDLQAVALVLDRHDLARLSGFGARRRQLDRAGLEGEAHRPQLLVGHHGGPPNAIGQGAGGGDDGLVVVARYHHFVVRELPGEDPRDQALSADREEEVVLVAREPDRQIAVADQLLDLRERLAWNQGADLSGYPRDLHRLAHHRQAMAVGRDHADVASGQKDQRPVERVARLLLGDRKHRALDHGAQQRSRQIDGRGSPLRYGRKVFLREPDDLVLRAAGADPDPFVFQDAEVDDRVFREEANDVEQPAGGKGGRPLPPDPGRAPATDADIQVGRSQVEALAGGLEQDVRKDRDRAFLLDDPLDQVQLGKQVVALHREFH